MAKVQANNLYANGRVVQFKDGTHILIRDKLKFTDFIKFDYHTVIEDDELSAIAYKYYKSKAQDSSKYWWVVADVNNIMKPYDISDLIGKELVIPNILEVKK